MAVVSSVKARVYQDSVRLMRLSERLSGLDGVRQAFVAMGTDANKRVLAEAGLFTEQVHAAGANDLMIVVDAASGEAADYALGTVEALLATPIRTEGGDGVTATVCTTIEQARRQLPDANLMLISVAGQYATLAAAGALQAGMHVLLFSDNVSLEDERALKLLAVSRGLLLMGPGCGTAVINGVALAFANVLRRGAVGLVAASGTGLQEVTTLLDRAGLGISQAIGVGGRDLSEAIGGMMMLQAIAMLAADPQTQLLVLISKPPAPAVAERVLAAGRASGKPVIAAFLGSRHTGVQDGVTCTPTLEATAEAVYRRLTGDERSPFALEPEAFERLVAEQRRRLRPGQRYVRGLFSGGSLCEEAMQILTDQLGDIYSNIPLDPHQALSDAWKSRANCCVDLGEEEFTRGRPHPMIDPRLRQERLLREAADPEVAVILLDVVIGYGAHPDPAGALGPAIEEARSKAAAAGRHLAVVCHVCGTVQDPQNLERQERRLIEAGALVLPTNAQAARVAAAIVR